MLAAKRSDHAEERTVKGVLRHSGQETGKRLVATASLEGEKKPSLTLVEDSATLRNVIVNIDEHQKENVHTGENGKGNIIIVIPKAKTRNIYIYIYIYAY